MFCKRQHLTYNKQYKNHRWALRFDVLANAENGDSDSVKSECNFTKIAIDISQKALMNFNVTAASLNSWLEEDHSQAFTPPENDSFGDMPTTSRWLSAMGMAFAYDLFVIYVIKMYFMTFLAIVTFNPHKKDITYFWANDDFFLDMGKKV